MYRKVAGFTLIEIMVVVAIVALLLITGLTLLLPSLLKGRDGRRKADLHKIANALEEYYNNELSYPATITACGRTTSISSVMKDVPCEAETTQPYFYLADPVGCDGGTTVRCSGFRLMTDLENNDDPDIEQQGCTISFSGEKGCHKSGSTVYDYGIAVGRLLSD
jgi:prepilin-type N-terminal cleavage/methylation domain-containing protein